MIVVTGAAGFIGSNIVKRLNEQGHKDIIAVDDLENGHKFVNLVDCEIADYLDKDAFIQAVLDDSLGPIEVIFHQGACSTTTEWNGRYMMENNFTYSKQLLHYAIEREIPFIYASSAAVYGASKEFKEDPKNEKPLNVYGYSKLLFDQYVRRLLPEIRSQVVGLRYFNVYGPREQHKGSMASVAFHHNGQLLETGKVKLFEGCDGYGDGEQLRDFVFVGDCVSVNVWFWQSQAKSGIYNLGTGNAEPFNNIAKGVIDWHKKGNIEYIPFPEHLKGAYQSYTQADISQLRDAGYEAKFHTVAEGVATYLDWLATQ